LDGSDGCDGVQFRRAIGASADDRIIEMFRDGGWEARICADFKVPTETARANRR
jgi:hypothetical protein